MNDILNEALHTNLESNSPNTRSISQISWQSVHEGGMSALRTGCIYPPPPGEVTGTHFC